MFRQCMIQPNLPKSTRWFKQQFGKALAWSKWVVWLIHNDGWNMNPSQSNGVQGTIKWVVGTGSSTWNYSSKEIYLARIINSEPKITLIREIRTHETITQEPVDEMTWTFDNNHLKNLVDFSLAKPCLCQTMPSLGHVLLC